MQIIGQYMKFLHSPLSALCLLESVVSIATRYGLDGLGIESGWKGRFSAPVQKALGPAQPHMQWVRVLYRG